METNQFSEVVELKPKTQFKMYLAGNWQAYLPAPHQCLSAQVLSFLGSSTRWNKNMQFFPNSCLLKFTYRIKWFFVLLLYPLGSCITGCFMHRLFIADTLPIIFSRKLVISQCNKFTIIYSRKHLGVAGLTFLFVVPSCQVLLCCCLLPSSCCASPHQEWLQFWAKLGRETERPWRLVCKVW